MINVQSTIAKTGNAYVMFGFEAIQARPNLDPYTSTLRTNDETMQVFTSDVHIKHHARRGIKAYAIEKGITKPDAAIFYEKEDEAGNPRDFSKRLQLVRDASGISKANVDKKDALNYCLDLPLFGYVHAVKGESFNVTNSMNTLFRPSTFHSCKILPIGRNNAFPSLDKAGEVNDSSGSATVDSLEYGFFLSIWEINLNMLRVNAENHKTMVWKDKGAAGWLDIFLNGLWAAYTTARYPSFTQRSQFAQFIVGWQPKDSDVSYENPAELYRKLEDKMINSHEDAVKNLNSFLPEFLKGWKCSKENIFAKALAKNCEIQCLV